MWSPLGQIRRAVGVTQEAVAKAMGVGQSTVSNLERRTDPRLSSLRRWAQALGGTLRVTLELDGHAYDLDPTRPEQEGPARRPPRRMRVIWQNPTNKSFRHVGDLEDDGYLYRFQYTNDSGEEDQPTFDAFPDRSRTYDSTTLWSFFNDRPAATLGVLLGAENRPLPLAELDGDQDTFGGRLQLVPDPALSATGDAWTFLASGVRYIDAEAEQVLADLRSGDTLTLERAFDYDHPTSFARRLKHNRAALGWLPDYVISDVDRLEEAGHRFRVEVVRVQPPDGNPHLRLLCKLVVDA